MVRRPPAPAYWRNIAPFLRALPTPETTDRQRHWLLVLQAKAIPYKFFERGPLPALYVPPVAAKAALHEITAFETERPAPPLPLPPDRPGSYWYAALLAVLIPWHRMRWSSLFPLPCLPATPRDWLTAGGLDAYRVTVSHEWHRAVTALTLHADGAHLLSNVVTGALFGIPLCRYTGVGLGFLLTVLAGAVGNIATAYLRHASAMSQGFSTAVFASVGLLAAFSSAFAARHAYATTKKDRAHAALKHGVFKGLIPVGAGLGLLAMLGGSEAPGVDYLAHVMGLVAGLVLGLSAAFGAPGVFRLRGKKNMALQTASLIASFALIAVCWAMALDAS
ncbi:rhomboid family intramembrane serine protease [Desulfovibrio sp. OttesenSCG-928-O18]|nr:rhomboid family intramembrane serine protease [Desulfovibrio sp. OttesenSCG-928-O18]